MTVQDLKEYLKQLVGGGVAVPNIDNIVNTAAESGYQWVWGAHPWKAKRVQTTTLTTTASQDYTEMPTDFESLRGIRVRSTTNPIWVDIVDEEGFDLSHPNPALYTNDMPLKLKVVYDASLGTKKYRVYWFPIPDGTYSLTVVYDIKGDLDNLPNLPSFMIDPVVAKASALMRTGTERAEMDMVAERSLQRAIMSDRVVTSHSPRFGVDPGWDDFSMSARSGGPVWNPHSL